MSTSRKPFLLLALMCLLAWAVALPASRQRNQHATSQPGVFDFYVLNLSWSPEFCHGHPDKPECQTGHFGFVVHGLWPQFTNGFPEHCSNTPGPSNPGSMTDIMPDTGLVAHEWTTHGTCSGLDADSYFKLIRQAYGTVKIPADLAAPHSAVSMTPAEIKQDFIKSNPRLSNQNLAVSCGNNFLTAISVCMTRTLDPTTCGPSVRDCRANSVKITPVR